ncbi:MAG: glycosyltransferase family 4 protein [Propionibacteriaceae bacterium]|nr:glycosyltransferase family 4 protein [Propionibacteriaceae bacterium]
MRILLLSHHYTPETGPPQLRWDGLARELTSAGHGLDVIAPHPHYPIGSLLDGYEPPDRLSEPQTGSHGESIYRVSFRETKGDLGSVMINQLVVAFFTMVAVFRLRKQLQSDIIVATAPAMPTLVAGWFAKLLLGRPLVMEIRDAWPDLVTVSDHWDGARQKPSLKKRIGLSVAPAGITWLQRRADHVITTTDTFAEILRERGISNVTTVRNSWHEIENYEAKNPRPSDGTLRVVYVGTVGRAQGLVTAVEALRIARAQGADIEMRVIGTGAGKQAVTALAEAEDLPIIVRGAQARSEIHHHYEWGDTFLVMLRDWEPLRWTVPSKLYEAMSLGMHVSGSIAGEAADIIAETECGFVVPPEDPDALATQWIRLSKDLPPRPDQALSAAWLKENASEPLAARIYLEVLAGMLLPAASQQQATLRSVSRAGVPTARPR